MVMAYADYHQLDFSFSKSVNVSKLWKTFMEDITSELPQSQEFTMTFADSYIIATLFKRKVENETVSGKDIKNLF